MNHACKWLVLLFVPCMLAQAADQGAEEAKIRQSVDAYIAAFNKGDAKGLAALWSPDAVYMNPLTGAEASGREAIEKQFAANFAVAKGAKLEAKTESIKFVSPSVAIEQGTAKVTAAGRAGEESEYSAVYVKRDGQWLLDRVTEEEPFKPHSNYEHLKELEWMVGTWIDEDAKSKIETNVHWAKNQNFLIRSFTISVGDRINQSGMQIVGWDAGKKKIRSWVFDSEGGFGEGTWSKKGNTWHIQTAGTTNDGRKVSSVNIISLVNNDQFTWQIVNGQIGDELLPNVDAVLVVRQKE